jgi:hypothetical protein
MTLILIVAHERPPAGVLAAILYEIIRQLAFSYSLSSFSNFSSITSSDTNALS